MKVKPYFIAAFVLLPVALVAEDKLTLESLPQPVQAAIKKNVGSLPITSITKESDEGTYEVETTYNGKPRSYAFTAKGRLTEIEDTVDLDSIPAAAKAAIQKKAAGGTIQEVEKVTSGGKTSYEADVTTSAGKKIEVAVTAGGVVKGVENAENDKD